MDISQIMLNNVHVLYERRDNSQPPSDQEKNIYQSLRVLHSMLLSRANSIPRYARPILQMVGLLRSPAQIEEGARMLIGISNQMITADKDLPHVTAMIEKLKAALDIAA